MSEIRRLIQKPFPGVEVDMYDIDLTSKGGKLMHFTNWVLEDGEKIKWRGNTYEPIALEVKGFAATSEGKPPRPKMKVANAVFEGGLTESLSTLAAEFDDFVGCKVVRWRTYRQFLDDGEQADPGTYFPLDEYIVSSKLEETPVAIEWELAMPLEQEGLMIPRIVMTQKYCPWTYRLWDEDEEEFIYTDVICPYQGEDMFTEDDEPTTDPKEDRCSKRLTGCRLRFGINDPLPIGAFPGMLRLTRRN